MKRLTLALALVATALALPARSAPVGGTDGPDGCLAVAFSPAVASDHLGVCAGFLVDFTGASPKFTLGYAMYVTHDLGHTWVQVPAAGLVADEFSTIGGLAFSPAYATDHTIFIQTQSFDGTSGVFASTDLGASWASVDSNVTGALDDLVGVAPTGVAGTPAALATVLTVSRESDDLVAEAAGPLHIAAAGSPDDDTDVLPAAGLMLARTTDATEADATRQHATLYGCDAAYTCTTVKHSWAYGELPDRAWSAPDYATSHEVVVLTRGSDYRRALHAWVSKDGGAHFTASASMNRLLANAAAREGAAVHASLVWKPGAPRTRYLRIATEFGSSDFTAHEEIWRSTNGGATWTRLAYRSCGAVKKQYVCRGSIPWLWGAAYAAKHFADLAVLPDGRLIVVAQTEAVDPATHLYSRYFGTFCSVDDGKHWTKSCSR